LEKNREIFSILNVHNWLSARHLEQRLKAEVERCSQKDKYIARGTQTAGLEQDLP
jgi:hypothetical protein